MLKGRAALIPFLSAALMVVGVSSCKKNHPPDVPPTPGGPASVIVGDSGQYVTSTTDPDGDDLAYQFDWGDGNQSAWSALVHGGEAVTMSKAWPTQSTFSVRSRARDRKEAISEWSNEFRVTTVPNYAPGMPSIAGPQYGYVNISYTFSLGAVDPNLDSVSLQVDWGDGVVTAWSAFVPSGAVVSMAKVWISPRNYYAVKARAKDRREAMSSWTPENPVIIMPNDPPDTPPVPSGPDTVLFGTKNRYSALTTDPDGDSISYQFHWGRAMDDTTAWSDYRPNGSSCADSTAWSTVGNYSVKARAKDSKGAVSSWSQARTVTVRSNAPSTPSTPSGPSSGRTDTTYSFSSSASDPDGDSVALRFSWGDGDTSNWSGIVPSGQAVTMTHAWSDTGVHQVKAQARDKSQAKSGWSSARAILITRNWPPVASSPSGPSSGKPHVSYSYSCSASDPNGDSVAVRLSWGNGDTSSWSSFVPPGQTVSMTHSWPDSGIYQVKAQARDKEGALSQWSSGCQVDIRNRPPSTASTPVGPSNGKPNVSYSFSSSATDPDGDSVSVRFAWGDGDSSSWSNPVPSGQFVSMSHVWPDTGIYLIRSQARDVDGSLSSWSTEYSVDIRNRTPGIPTTPAGPSSGKPNRAYDFSSSATDPDGDSVSLRFAWGDGDTSSWSNLVPSGQAATMSHTWPDTGIYLIRAQAKDWEGALSVWSSSLVIHLMSRAPHAPLTPSGPSSGQPNIAYNFSSSATDPDGDSVMVRFSWADGDTTNWSPYVPSGQAVTMSHIWLDYGTHLVVAQAKDVDGMLSPWSSGHPVEICPPLKWRYYTGDSVQSSPAIGADGTVYVGSSDGYLYALNPTGTLKWRYGAGTYAFPSPAIAADGTVYCSGWNAEQGNVHLYALNPTGTLKWSYRIGWQEVRSSPAVAADGTVYVGSDVNVFYALNPTGTLKWMYLTTQGSSVPSSPAVGSDGTVYVGSNDHYLYALNPTGTLKWRYESSQAVYSSPAIGSDGSVYVGSNDHYLYALNPTGTLKWRYYTNAGTPSPAVGSDGTVYVGSSDGYLYALNPTGTLKWRYQTGGGMSSPAIGSYGTICVGSLDSCLYALNPDGTLEWRYRTLGSVCSSPAIGSDGTIYVGSNDGYLYSIQTTGTLANAPWPKFRHDSKNTGRVGGSR